MENPSQLLLRNEALLVAERILVVNYFADGLLERLRQLNKTAHISCFTSNFSVHNRQQQTQTDIQAQVGASISTANKVGNWDLIICYYPKAKPEAQMLFDNIAAIADQSTRLLVVGDNKGGVKSAPKQIKSTAHRKVDSARHCSLFEFSEFNSNDTFELERYSKEYAVEIDGYTIQVVTLPGVFSQNHLDQGTELLLKHLPRLKPGDLLDFGCGAGVISAFIGKKYPEMKLACADVSALALQATQLTLKKNDLAADFILTDGLSHIENKYKHIVTNPPFHTGLKTDYQITENFIKSLKSNMKSRSQLILVANGFLKYAPLITEYFGHCNQLAKNNKFILHQASN